MSRIEVAQKQRFRGKFLVANFAPIDGCQNFTAFVSGNTWQGRIVFDRINPFGQTFESDFSQLV
jgi:hypothetical protein